MIAYLTGTFGLTSVGLRAALCDKGLESFAMLAELSCADVSACCKNVRRPGGHLLVNGAEVPNRGHDVSIVLENRLCMLWYFCRYMYMTQRRPDPVDASLANLQSVRQYMMNLDKNPAKPGLFEGPAKARNFFEELDDYLSRAPGAGGLPLAYVTRKTPAISTPDSGYFQPSVEDDMHARGRHDGMFWVLDNNEVFAVLRACLHGTQWYTWIKPFQRTRNGNGAYQAARNQFLGPSEQRAQTAEADTIIETLTFDGRNRNFTFAKFTTKLTKAFLDQGPDDQMSDEKKVTKLLKAIKCPNLTASKSTIMATEHLKTDYQAAVSFLQEQVSTELAATRGRPQDSRNVSSLDRSSRGGRGGRGRGGRRGGRGGRGRGGGATRFDPANPNAYLARATWVAMTPAQQEAARAARTSGGHVPKRKREEQIVCTLASVTTNLESMQARLSEIAVGSPGRMVGSATTTPAASTPATYTIDSHGNFIIQR